MRRYCLLTLIVMVCLTWASLADDKPAGKKPFILLNNNTVIPDGTATNGQYSQFAQACREAGFSIDHRYLHGGVTEDDLEGVDIFILTMPAFYLLEEDKVALRKFIRAGGGLFVALYPGFSDPANIDSFIKDYGISQGLKITGSFAGRVPANSPLRQPTNCNYLGSTNTFSYRVDLVINSNAESAATTDE